MKYVSSPKLVARGKLFLHTSQWVLTSAEPFMTHCGPESQPETAQVIYYSCASSPALKQGTLWRVEVVFLTLLSKGWLSSSAGF